LIPDPENLCFKFLPLYQLRFAKNLSADSIQLSTLRGEGELSNLELDCVAIQNLVNLPTWLQINHAKCNRVHVKVN